MKLIILSIFLLAVLSHQLKSQDKLVQVVQVFRHGARSQAFDQTPSKFDIPDGELTQIGMRQHYLLGQQMRKRYVNKFQFLSTTFKTQELYIRSTDYNRTIQSVQSHLTGLFPPGTGPEFNKNQSQDIAIPPYKAKYNFRKLKNDALPHQIQQIPIHIIRDVDQVFVDWYTCPELMQIYQDQLKSEFVLDTLREFNQTIQTLCKATNFTYTSNFTFYDFYGIYDNIYADRYYGIPTPQFDEETQRNLTYLYSLEGHVDQQNTREQILTQNSPFWADVLKFSNKKIVQREQDSLKWITYSAHDSTLIQLMAGFNLTNKQCIKEKFYTGKTNALNCIDAFPTYASQMLLELYQKQNTNGLNKDDYYVKLDYNGKYMNLCDTNSKKCSFTEFEARLNAQMIPNSQNVCLKKFYAPQQPINKEFLSLLKRK